MIVALFDKAGLVSDQDLFRLKRALEVSGQHRAAAWGIDAPAIEIRRRESSLNPGEMALVFVQDVDDDEGALAVHFWDGSRGEPAGRVYVDRSSGLTSGPYSYGEAASHELEALCNPDLSEWRWHPDPMRANVGVQVALETDDPTQDTYDVQVPDERGELRTFKMSNFVLPSWFESQNPREFDPSARYDYASRLQRPGQVGPEGYCILRRLVPGTRSFEYWLEDSSGQRFGAVQPNPRAPGKQRVRIGGRTQRLLAGRRL